MTSSSSAATAQLADRGPDVCSAARRGASIAFRAVARDSQAHRSRPPQHVDARRFFEKAIRFSATHVRVGTAIFGSRGGGPSEAPAKSHHAGASPGSGGRFDAVLDGTRHTGTKIEAYRECQHGSRRTVVGSGPEAERAASDRRASKGSLRTTSAPPASRRCSRAHPKCAGGGRGPAWCRRDRDRRSRRMTIRWHFPVISRLWRLSGYLGCKEIPGYK